MKRFQRPMLINAVLALGLILFDYLFIAKNEEPFFFSGLFIVLLAPINFVIGMIRNRNRKGDGPAYFLIAGVLLLIGFSVCSFSAGIF